MDGSSGLLIVVTGLPGSGKTTLAGRLAPALPAVRLCPDDWMVASGIDLWDQRARAQIEEGQRGLAFGLLERGRDVIIEWGTWARAERDSLLAEARDRRVATELHATTAPIEELWRRIEVRNREGRWGARPITRAEVEDWAQAYEAPTAEELAAWNGGTEREPEPSVQLRPAVASDAGFLADALAIAADWRPGTTPRTGHEVLGDPALAPYLAGWPEPDDLGVIAAADGRPIGAAWLRYFPAEHPGYGTIGPDVPELSIGVVTEARGRGVGGGLLDALLAEADGKRIARTSLSVEFDNPARRLYASRGFAVVDATGGAITMVRVAGPTTDPRP